MTDHITEDYLSNIRVKGTWADHTAIQGIARMLKIDILIITSKEQSTDLGFLKFIIPGGENGTSACTSSTDCICLGHINELHYVSLQPISTDEQISNAEELKESAAEPSLITIAMTVHVDQVRITCVIRFILSSSTALRTSSFCCFLYD